VDPRPLGRLIALRLGAVILVYGPRDSSSLLPSDKSPTGPSLRDFGGRTTDGFFSVLGRRDVRCVGPF